MASSIPASVLEAIRPHVGEVDQGQSVGGGCIAHATRIDTERGRYFLKWADGEAGATFEAEAAGLRALAAADASLHVPQPIVACNASATAGMLLMEWVESGSADASFWTGFGEALADLHRHRSKDSRYGFDRDNFIGRTAQQNAWMDTWPAFFRARRLEPQIALARRQGRWKADWDTPADRLLERLDDLLPAAPPASVLHGDLWSGNFLAAEDGRAALIDPATYYGHRETDLALTELFGGFDARFYEAYRAAWPLGPGYAERREVYNLYHLLNHLNLFGGSYASGVQRTLYQFG